MLFDFVTALDGFFHDQIHVRMRTMNQRTHLACEVNQGLLLGMDSQSVLMRQTMLGYQVMWRCKVKKVRLERMTKCPIFSVFQIQINLPKKILMLNHSRTNPLSHDYHIHEDESLLNSLRETCARDSQRRVFILFPLVKLLWHSVRIAWNLLVCRINNRKKVGVEVSLKTTGLLLRHFSARARVEVNIKKLTADERAQFRAAQHKEMDQWISNDVISICQRAGTPEERVMTMRRVHTWKVAEDKVETKAKARLVVKGFTDPDLTEIRAESPTLRRLPRQLILQLSASRGFRLRKGDVKSAFLSGDLEEARRDVYAEPPQEMRDKLQIRRERVLKLKTAGYGLRNAPRTWWKRIVRDLTETGWVQHQLDQCTFMFMKCTELVGFIGVYVGDFLVAGCDDDPVFSAALSKLKGTVQWRTWHEDNCILAGIEIETLPDGGFHLRQQEFLDELELISLSQRRSRAGTDKLTPGELTQLRGVSGSANWLPDQTRRDLCVSTSLRQGAHASATVADTREANKLIRLCRQHAHFPIRVSLIPLDDLTFVGFGDCGWGVRRDGSSQGGSMIIAADKRILDGFEATTAIVDWKSCRCFRVVRSSLADETQAYVGTLDMLEFTSVIYALFLDPWKSLSDGASIFEKQHKSPLITDAKSLYDALGRSESSTQNLTERRTAIEVTAIRQRLEHGFIYTGWVNIDTEMADGLTKPQAAWKLLEIMSAGNWKIVWDATFKNARKLLVAERSEGKRDLDGWRILDDNSAVSRCLLTSFYSRRIMMIPDDSYSGSVVTILKISCDASKHNIHDYCPSRDLPTYDTHD